MGEWSREAGEASGESGARLDQQLDERGMPALGGHMQRRQSPCAEPPGVDVDAIAANQELGYAARTRVGDVSTGLVASATPRNHVQRRLVRAVSCAGVRARVEQRGDRRQVLPRATTDREVQWDIPLLVALVQVGAHPRVLVFVKLATDRDAERLDLALFGCLVQADPSSLGDRQQSEKQARITYKKKGINPHSVSQTQKAHSLRYENLTDLPTRKSIKKALALKKPLFDSKAIFQNKLLQQIIPVNAINPIEQYFNYQVARPRSRAKTASSDKKVRKGNSLLNKR